MNGEGEVGGSNNQSGTILMLIVPLCGRFCMRDIKWRPLTCPCTPSEAGRYLNTPTLIDSATSGFLILVFFSGPTQSLGALDKKQRWAHVCKSVNILLNILNCGYFNLEGSGVPPFVVLLGLLSDPLLALFVLQGDKVPVVVNQKILGDNIRNTLKPESNDSTLHFLWVRFLEIPWSQLCLHL